MNKQVGRVLLLVVCSLVFGGSCLGQKEPEKYTISSSKGVQIGSNNYQFNTYFINQCEFQTNEVEGVALLSTFVKKSEYLFELFARENPKISSLRDSLTYITNQVVSPKLKLAQRLNWITKCLTFFDIHSVGYKSIDNDSIRNLLVELGDYGKLLCRPDSLSQVITSETVYILTGLSGKGSSTEYRQGLRKVQQNRRYGFTNDDSTFVIPPIWDRAYDFEDGLALVCNGRDCRYYDVNGKLAVTPPNPNVEVEPFSEGRAVIRLRSGACNYIDKEGKFIFEKDFIDCGKYVGGIAPVRVRFPTGKSDNVLTWPIDLTNSGHPNFQVPVDTKWGFISSSGRFVIKPIYEYADSYIDAGFARVAVNDTTWFFIDANGTQITPSFFQFLRRDDYSIAVDKDLFHTSNMLYDEKLIPIRSDIGLDIEIKEGYIIYEYVGKGKTLMDIFSTNRENEKKTSNNIGVISKRGDVIIPPNYDRITPLNNNVLELRVGEVVKTVSIDVEAKKYTVLFTNEWVDFDSK